MAIGNGPGLVLAGNKVPPHERSIRLGGRPHILVVDGNSTLGGRQRHHTDHLAVELKVPLDLGNVGAQAHHLASPALVLPRVPSHTHAALLVSSRTATHTVGGHHGSDLVLATVGEREIQDPSSAVSGNELHHLGINGVTALEKPLGTKGLSVDNVAACSRVVVKVAGVLGLDKVELDGVVVGLLATASKHGRVDHHLFQWTSASLGNDVVDAHVGGHSLEEENAVSRVGRNGVKVDSWVSMCGGGAWAAARVGFRISHRVR